MRIKDLLKRDFGVDLPIKGGNGHSIADAIIIEKQIPNDYVGIEHYMIKLIGIARNIEWKKIQQSLLHIDDRKIDEITIETKQKKDTETLTEIENFYFDITECIA